MVRADHSPDPGQGQEGVEVAGAVDDTAAAAAASAVPSTSAMPGPSQGAPLSLSATLARGAHHQCGTARRVKVYELKGETWHDRGTGYCAGVYDEQNDAALLVARMEETCRRLTLSAGGEGGEGAEGRRAGPTSTVSNATEGEEQQGTDEQLGTEGREDREHYVLVVSESLDTDDLLLKARVVKDDVYQRQQDTLVVWTEPDGTDMALSFQEADGCHEVWEFLAEVQKHFLLSARGEGLEMDDAEGLNSGVLGMSAAGMTTESALVMSDGSPFALPEPRLDNVAVIEITLKDAASRSLQAREKVAQWILRENYILQLIPIFHDAEELEQLDALHRLCAIVHTIIMLNDNMLIERMLRDDTFLGVAGMLEYDPDFPQLKASYRDYLHNTARFREVVPISDEIILAKIHQTFRLQYLKDVILARTLDDSTFAVLNSLIFYHQADIVVFCTSSEPFLSSLFRLFEPGQAGSSEEKKAEAIIFLQQLCAVGKQVQLPSRLALYRTLTEWGLLVVLEYALTRNEARLRNASAEILMSIIEYDASGVRLHILEQVNAQGGGNTSLLSTLAAILHEADGDLGLKTQVTESLRILFDSGPDGVTGGPVVAQTLAAAAAAQTSGESQRKDEADRFLNWLYENEVDRLFEPLKTLRKYKEPTAKDGAELIPPPLIIVPASRSAMLNHLCELLTFVMAHHHFRSQYWVISSDIGSRVLSLLFAREKHLRLAALRFFRACLAKGNQFINRHFIKIGLLSAILGAVEAEAARDNLVTSACLEFFEHVRKENIKPLISHLMDRHEQRVRTLTRHGAIGHYFQAMVLQWEKSSEVPPTTQSDTEEGSQLASMEAERIRRRRDLARRGENRATMDSDEESYFNDDLDEEEEKEEDDENVAPSSDGKEELQSMMASQAASILPRPPSSPPAVAAFVGGRSRSGSGVVPYVPGEAEEQDTPITATATTDADAATADLSAMSDSVATSESDSDQSLSTEVSHGEAIAPSLSLQDSPQTNLSKRKKRDDEEEDDDDVMTRLAKRKSIASDEAQTTTAEQVRINVVDPPPPPPPQQQAGGKRVPISLSADAAEKLTSAEKEEGEG